ncbi:MULTISPECIES: hypothetical protein [Acetobacter]|uniref:hypothetical protein n=1 Tax=Acetobacter TaxID=434 RepID=UPI00376F7844
MTLPHACWRMYFLLSLTTLTSCSGMVVDGQFTPMGQPTGSFQYFGHRFDITPVFGKTDWFILRGTHSILDSELHDVHIVMQRTYPDESIIVIQGQRYPGDYLPTWEILTAKQHSLHVSLIPASGGNPPFSFVYNQDGLEIHSSDGPGLFFRDQTFYSLPRYRNAVQRIEHRTRAHYTPPHSPSSNSSRLHFVDDVGKVTGSGIRGLDTQNQSINLQN